MTSRKYLATSSVAILALATSAARAQTIDYGSLEQLFGEPVTTSATGSPQKATEAPVDMEIVTADDIRRSGANNIPEVLSHVSGVNVLQWANDSYDVGIRGYDQGFSPRILVLIDGRQVYADYFGFTPWDALPVELSEIRQIEIVKGPNSALFGFNAVGGVINIVTYNPLYDKQNTVTVLGGTQGLAEGNAVGTVKISDWAGLRIGVGGRSDDDFSTPQLANNVGTRRGDNRGEINVEGVFRLADNIQATLEATRSQSKQTESNVSVFSSSADYRTDSLKGQISADTNLGLLTATAYTDWIKSDSFSETSNTPGIVSNQVTVVQFQDLYKIGTDTTLRGDLEYRHNAANNSTLPGASVFYDVLSASAMWEWKIKPDLTLTNAFRIDDLMLGRDGPAPPGPFTNASWDRTIVQPSFNSGLVWRPDDVSTLRVTAARGVQVPNLIEFGLNFFKAPGFLELSTPNLAPTVVTNYELGWDRDISAINGQLRIAAFHQQTDELASIFGTESFSPAGLQIISANIGSSKADGAEFELKGKFLKDWHWDLNYTPEFVTDHFNPDSPPTVTETEFQHTTPNHIVKVNVGWAQDKWEADLFGQYQSRTIGQVAGAGAGAAFVPVQDYFSADARVAYKVTDWATLALYGQNITQSTQQQTAVAKVERVVFGSLTFNF
jgi:iron complex outermembrane receptor protein